jgi:Tfp pilus assembly protein PilV
MSNTTRSDIDLRQAGMVSIIVTVILMFVISITVLGFAQIIRRSQREALDAQLSAQAFYAAESGINDARTAIANNGGVVESKTDCKNADPTSIYKDLDGIVDQADNVSYSCLLVDPAPTDLSYPLSASNGSEVIPVNAPAAIDRINLSWTRDPNWSAPDASCPAQGLTDLPTKACWNSPYAMLRVDLVPTGDLARSALLADTFTAFVSPKGAGGTVGYTGSGANIHGGAANQGARPSASCSASSCTIAITGLSASQYYLRVSLMYNNETVLTVSAERGGVDQPLSGAEAVVDATGKAQDVLRRIQVHVPLSSNAIHSDYALETTDDICKNFTTFPGYPIACN